MRFDGQMSSKRRQETIAQFSVPLDNDSNGDDTPVMDSSDEVLGHEDDAYRTARTRSLSKGKGKASVNPRVMLLSLKAVCLSLSATILKLI